MGKIRESGSFLFDMPKVSDILLNDTLNIIIFMSEDGMDSMSYDSYDELKRRSVLGSARAIQLKKRLERKLKI